jgi:hypothetical protein
MFPLSPLRIGEGMGEGLVHMRAAPAPFRNLEPVGWAPVAVEASG